MATPVSIAEIELINRQGEKAGLVRISPKNDSAILNIPEEQQEQKDYCYLPVQLFEGRKYIYELETVDKGLNLRESAQVSAIKGNIGLIDTGIYTGILPLELVNEDSEIVATGYVEVQSLKSGALKHYREMLSEISEECAELLMRFDSPVHARFESDSEKDPRTLTQRFYFTRSLLESENSSFHKALNRILRSPHVRTRGEEIEVPLQRGVRHWGPREMLQMLSRHPRMDIPDKHTLKEQYGLASIPEKIVTRTYSETTDIPENRFIKYALKYFVFYLSKIESILEEKNENRFVVSEVKRMSSRLEEYLSHSFFRQISNPDIINLGSPVLQRKEGYREILRIWIQFNLASKLVWKNSDDSFNAGQRDVPAIYEYWLFFKLVKLMKEMFNVDVDKGKLITIEDDKGFNLNLVQGTQLPFYGKYLQDMKQVLNVCFCYNRSFPGKSAHEKPFPSYPKEGSWTKIMRPDYTVSFWPADKNETDAEKEEKIVHIHLDAKYKISSLGKDVFSPAEIVKLFEDDSNDKFDTPEEYLGDDDDNEALREQKQSERKGIASKREDLLKMHAYHDSIRRTEGAYIIYPGSPDKQKLWGGYHELLPGIGAFPVCPGSNDDMDNVKDFLKHSADLCVDRFSQLYRHKYWIGKNIISDESSIYGMDCHVEKHSPKDDNDVMCGFIREDSVKHCKENLFFYFHAMGKKEFIDFKYDKEFCFFVPFNKDRGWFGWYAEISSVNIVQYDDLISMGIHLESSKSEMPIYYAVRLKPGTREDFKVIPSMKTQLVPGRPYFKKWAELYK